MHQKETNIANIGFSSITSILSNIHNEQLSMSTVLGFVKDSVEKIATSGILSVSEILNNQIKFHSLKHSLLTSINNRLGLINDSLLSMFGDLGMKNSDTTVVQNQISSTPIVNELISIRELLKNYFESKLNSSKSINTPLGEDTDTMSSKLGSMFSNAINSSVLTDNMLRVMNDIHVALLHANMILNDALDYIRDIYFLIPDISSGSSKTATQSVKTRNAEFNKLLESFTELQNRLSDKFIKNFGEFVKFYTTFIDEKNSKKLRLSATNLNIFAGSLKTVSFLLGGVNKIFTSLTLSIVMLSLSIVNPLFYGAIGVLAGVMTTLRNTFGDLKTVVLLPKAILNIGLATGIFVGSLLLIKNVSWSALGKFLVFVTSLMAVFKLFGGNQQGLSDAFAGKKTVFKSSVGGIFTAALGLSILVLALNSVKNVDFAKASMLLVFMGGLALTMRIMNRGNMLNPKSSAGNDFMKLSLGLSILIIAVAAVGEVNWGAALGMIAGFVLGISLVMLIANKIMGSGGGLGKGGMNMVFSGNVSMKGMFGFAMGLAILLLVVDAIHEVNWKDTVLLLMFISAVSFAVAAPSLLTKGKMNGQPVGGMLGFSVGVAILLLTVDACSEVNWDNAWKLVLFMGALVLEFSYLQMHVDGSNLLKATAALVLGTVSLIGCLKLLDRVNIDYGKLLFFGASTLEFIGIMYIISKLQNQIKEGSKALFYLVGGMFMISGLIWYILSYVTIDIEKMLAFAIGTGIIIGLSVLASEFKTQIEEGALPLLAVSAVGVILAYAMRKIMDVDIQPLPFIGFMLATTTLVLGMAAASFIIVPAFIGAIGVLSVAVASILTAYALQKISELNISEDKIKTFGNSIISLIDAFDEIGLIAAGKAVIKAGMLFVISGVSILTSSALFLISALNIKEDKIKSFGNGIVSLIDSFDKVGLIAIGKAALKATALVAISAASILVAAAFKAIDTMQIGRDSLNNFGILVNRFLDATVDPINKASDKLKSIAPALNSLMKLVSISKGLLDIVESYANMKIGEWRYNQRTGKMEIVGYKKIDDKIFGAVGRNIGKLLQGLLEPLTIIASDDEVWNFNGVKVKNPFKNGWFGMDNNSGTNRIERIGNAFGSLVKSMNGLSANKFLSGYWKDYLRFKGILNDFIGMMILSINRFTNVNSDYFPKHGENISKFFDYINKISAPNDKRNLAGQVNELMNSLSDKVKWNTINNQLTRTHKNLDNIVKTINKISLQKATMLQKNLMLLSNARTAEQLQRCIAEIEQLISTIVEYQEKQQKANAQLTNTVAEAFGVNDKQRAEKNGVVFDKEGNVDRSKTDMKALLSEILSAVNALRVNADKNADMDVYVTNIKDLADAVKRNF